MKLLKTFKTTLPYTCKTCVQHYGNGGWYSIGKNVYRFKYEIN